MLLEFTRRRSSFPRTCVLLALAFVLAFPPTVELLKLAGVEGGCTTHEVDLSLGPLVCARTESITCGPVAWLVDVSCSSPKRADAVLGVVSSLGFRSEWSSAIPVSRGALGAWPDCRGGSLPYSSTR